MGGWTVAIHTPLSAMAPTVTFSAMRVSSWEEHQLWHATAQATGVGIYLPASVSVITLNSPVLVLLFWNLNSSSNVSNYNFCTFHFSAVQCKAIRALPSPLSMNCSHPLGNFSFGSQCLFTCREGFSLNGTGVLFCSSTGVWNDSLPKCTGKLIFFSFVFANSLRMTMLPNMLILSRYNVTMFTILI